MRISAARIDQRPLDPLLLVGPPGAGKTALAEIVAAKMGVPMEKLIMPVTFRALSTALRQLQDCVLFLDELHDLKARQSELLPLAEFGYLQDPSGKRIVANGLSIIGATTEPQQIIKPLYDRMVVPAYDPYTDVEMCLIIMGMADKQGFTLSEDIAMMFGIASCGTPRRARQFVLAYDAMAKDKGFLPTGDEVMAFLRIAHDGLTVKHLEYLRILDALGGAKGLKPIATLMRLNESMVQEIERLLFEKRMIEFGDRGRALTRQGFARLKNDATDMRAA